MPSNVSSVAEYLASLPEDRRGAIEALRRVILENLDADYAEGISYGMIGYAVPHRVYPAGYHADPRQPLPFASLASQKGHMALYLMAAYCGGDEPDARRYAEWFRAAWAKTGKKLEMGKACIRFRRLEDVPLDVIGEAVRRVPAKTYVSWYEAGLGQGEAGKQARAKTGATTRNAGPATEGAAAKAAGEASAKKGAAAKAGAKNVAAGARTKKTTAEVGATKATAEVGAKKGAGQGASKGGVGARKSAAGGAARGGARRA